MSGPIVVVHIPKTGGTSLVAALRGVTTRAKRVPNVFSRREDAERFLREEAQSFGSGTVLHGHFTMTEAALLPAGSRLVTFLREPGSRAYSHWAHTNENRRARGKQPNPPYETPRVPSNLQARMLCGLPDPLARPADEELLHAALHNLGRFEAVGITERFDASLRLVEQRLGLPLLHEQHENVRHAEPVDLAELRRLNELDVTLYERALELVP